MCQRVKPEGDYIIHGYNSCRGSRRSPCSVILLGEDRKGGGSESVPEEAFIHGSIVNIDIEKQGIESRIESITVKMVDIVDFE